MKPVSKIKCRVPIASIYTYVLFTLKNVLRYLQGTKNLMLTYRYTDTLEVVAFSDSDYACYVDDKKFTSSYIFMMSEGAVSWKSAK